jgi:hypothetical protein
MTCTVHVFSLQHPISRGKPCLARFQLALLLWAPQRLLGHVGCVDGLCMWQGQVCEIVVLDGLRWLI